MEKQKTKRTLALVTGLVFLVTANLFTGCSLNGDDAKTSVIAQETTNSTGSSSTNTTTTDDENKVENGTSGGDSSSTNPTTTENPENTPNDSTTVDPNEPKEYDNYNDEYKNEEGWVIEGENGEMYENKDGGDQNWGNNFNNWGNSGEGGGMGQGPGDCFGEGNEECKDKALKADFRDITRMIRELEQMQKHDKEGTTDYQSYIDDLKSIEEELKAVTSQEEADAAREKINEVRMAMDTLRMQEEIDRLTKEIEKDEKMMTKDKEYLDSMKENVSDEWVTKIEEQIGRLDKMLEIKKQMLSAMQSGETWDVIDEYRWQIDEIRWAMDDFWYEFETVKQEQWATQMFDEVEKSLENFLNNEYNNLPEEMKAKADELVATAKELISIGREAQASGDTKTLEKVQMKLDELGRKGEKMLGKPKPKFNEMGFDEGMDKKFENFSGDMSYEDQMELVSKILASNPDMIEKILSSDAVLAEKTLKIFNKVPDDMRNEYVEKKNELGELYAEAVEKNPDLENYKGEILGFNYFGTALDELISALTSLRDGGMSVDELVNELQSLKDQSKEEKYEAKVVSFPDYDDSDWYYESVEGMTDFLNGKKSDDGGVVFAGGDKITFAETLKITLEKFGKNQSEGDTSYGSAQNHWAKGYYVTAEQMGLTLLDPDHLITRGEMARLIVEVTLGSPVSHSESSFSDLSTSDTYFDYIETLSDYGIMSGDSVDSGLPTVRSNDTINRAETAKVINAAYENLQFETVETGEFDALLEGF